jgi:hypothetical protein
MNNFFYTFRFVWFSSLKSSHHKWYCICFNLRNCWHNNVQIHWVSYKRFESQTKYCRFYWFSDFWNFSRFRFVSFSIQSFRWWDWKLSYCANALCSTWRQYISKICFCYFERLNHEWWKCNEFNQSIYFEKRKKCLIKKFLSNLNVISFLIINLILSNWFESNFFLSIFSC